MDQQAVTFLVGMAMLAGLAGVLIPWFPDILLIWGAGLVYGILVGWGTWGPWLFASMTVAAGSSPPVKTYGPIEIFFAFNIFCTRASTPS